MKTFTLSLLLLATAAVGTGCKKDCPLPDNCGLEPDSGNCEAYFPKYYYDKADKKCKEFIWGGCGGTVPFDTWAECQQQCGCRLSDAVN